MPSTRDPAALTSALRRAPAAAAPAPAIDSAATGHGAHPDTSIPDRLARASHTDLAAYALQLERQVAQMQAWGTAAEQCAVQLHAELVSRTQAYEQLRARAAAATASLASPPASPTSSTHPRVPDSLWLSAKLRAAEAAVARGKTERAALERALADAHARAGAAEADADRLRRAVRALAMDNAIIAGVAAEEHARLVSARRELAGAGQHVQQAPAKPHPPPVRVPEPSAAALHAAVPASDAVGPEPPSPTADLHASDSPPTGPCTPPTPAAGADDSDDLAMPVPLPPAMLASPPPPPSAQPSGRDPEVFDVVEALDKRGLRVHLAARRRRRAAAASVAPTAA